MDVASRIETDMVQTRSWNAHWNDSEIESFNSVNDKSGEAMLAIRLYVCALTAVFLVLVTMNGGVGILEGLVITCAILYLILDARTELKERQADLHQLEQLEQQLAVLLSD